MIEKSDEGRYVVLRVQRDGSLMPARQDLFDLYTEAKLWTEEPGPDAPEHRQGRFLITRIVDISDV